MQKIARTIEYVIRVRNTSPADEGCIGAIMDAHPDLSWDHSMRDGPDTLVFLTNEDDAKALRDILRKSEDL